MALNSHYFLKNGGHCVISIKASCIDSTAAPEAVFAQEVRTLSDYCIPSDILIPVHHYVPSYVRLPRRSSTQDVKANEWFSLLSRALKTSEALNVTSACFAHRAHS